ncbi:MAG: tyrosine-type recombinase/integrase [Raoultibacter sp.]
MSSLEESIEGYIAFKQALGFDYAGEAQRLHAYLAFCDGEPLTEESALEWACSGPGHPRSYQIQRYETVRRFSEFAYALDPGIFKLKPGILGSVGSRVVPYIFTDEDILILMKVARTCKSPDGLRGEGLAFLIGLMRSCGLRISEALNLRDSNFNVESSTLDIVDSKFGTSRTIYLLPDVADHIVAYQRFRNGIAGSPTSRLIVTTEGKPLGVDSAQGMFSEVRWALLGRGDSFEGRKARLHDMRHTFATMTILRWHRSGVDVNAMIPYLSAYLGHKKLSDTYWYLTGVPELLAVAADAFKAAGLASERATNGLD